MSPEMTPVQDDYCEQSSQPQSHQSCKGPPCHHMWITGEWSQVGINEEITELYLKTNSMKEKKSIYISIY